MKTVFLILCCCLPLKHLNLNSSYGNRIHPVTGQNKFHNGIDLQSRNDTVYAIAAGTSAINYDPILGIYIKITDGHITYTYGHLSFLLVGNGQVSEDMPIAITGSTGRVTGQHLHLSISYDSRPIDPLKFLYQTTIKSNNHE
ncbi:M23 family metallopeptidase [Mucilaginibacter phyllosphaerae]